MINVPPPTLPQAAPTVFKVLPVSSFPAVAPLPAPIEQKNGTQRCILDTATTVVSTSDSTFEFTLRAAIPPILDPPTVSNIVGGQKPGLDVHVQGVTLPANNKWVAIVQTGSPKKVVVSQMDLSGALMPFPLAIGGVGRHIHVSLVQVLKPILNGITSIANVVKSSAWPLSSGRSASQIGAAANIVASVSSAGAEIIGVGERFVAKHAAPEPAAGPLPAAILPKNTSSYPERRILRVRRPSARERTQIYAKESVETWLNGCNF